MKWFAPSLRGFRIAWLPGDLIAGGLLAAIAIPEQLATAHLAGMPPQMGLYAFVAGSLAFAAFGANRYLSTGADSTIAPIFAGAVAAIAAAGSASYPALVVVAALFTGIALVLAGALRAGWIADLLSIPVTIGFLAGIAAHIAIGQVPALLGTPEVSGSLVQQVIALAGSATHANALTLAIGASVFAVTLGAERISPRLPGALIGLAGACVASALWHLDRHGVALLGALPSAWPRVGLTFVDLHDAVQLVPIALVVALVCMVQTSVVLRAFPSDAGVPDDPNRDFAAVGIGSIVSSLLGSFAVDASPPRTAIAASSGARSQLAGVVAVAAVVALAGFGAQFAAYLPLSALAGVLVFIATRIFRLRDMLRVARFGGSEIWLVVAGALLVVLLPIETGMVLAIGLSLVHGIYIVARPPSTELVRVPGTTIWRPPHGLHEERVPGVLVFSPAAPIAFTNGDYIVGRLRALLAAQPTPVRLVVIEGSGVIDIDYSGAQMLLSEIARMRARGLVVALARLSNERACTAAERTGLAAAIGATYTFNSVQEAIDGLP